MDKGRTTHLKDYSTTPFLIEHVDLFLDLHDDHAMVRSRIHFFRNPEHQDRPDLVLQGESLELTGIALDGSRLAAGSYLVDGDRLVVKGLPGKGVLETTSRIEPQNNTSLSGLYRSKGLFCTQCEAEGFRRITWFLDRPDVMATYATTLEADQKRFPVLLSNGNLVEQGSAVGGRHWVRWEDPFPKPCYLFAAVAGDLRHIEDRFTTMSGREVTLQIYTDPHNAHKCDFAMGSLKHAMAWDEQVYGREYDLDIFMIVAVDDFNMGAMENKGLNIFNSSLVLALPEATTDDVFARIEGVVAHEYFHNWTGNRITCRDWFQVTLKEGLTVFRDQEFSSDMGSRAVQRIKDVQVLRTRQFPEDAGPMAHPIQPRSYQKIDNFYTATVYEKGAEVIRMIHTLLGADGFRKGTDRYFELHDGQAVTTEEFVLAMEQGGGRDLTQFRSWYHQIGTPRVKLCETWDEQQGTLTLDFEQSVPGWSEGATPGPLHIPIRIGLLDDDGGSLPLRIRGNGDSNNVDGLLELTREQQTFTLTGLKDRPHLSLLRGFTAPIKLERSISNTELAFLLARDTDTFARWEAGQELYRRSMLDAIADYVPGKPVAVAVEVISAWRSVLADTESDPALLALCLNLPGFTVLEQEVDQVDVDVLLEVIEAHRREIATQIKDDLVGAVERIGGEQSGGYARDARSVGLRAMRNLALDFLTALDDPEMAALCYRHFEQADNMTDTLGALTALTHMDAPERELALEAFARKWMDDSVVMNSWFSVQAISRRPDTLQRVKALFGHAAFDIKNPNKVRHLLGAFAMNNPGCFHERSGRGYSFFTDKMLEVDSLNGQMGAALARSFLTWKRFDKERSRLIRRELERIVANPGLSPNAYEIVSRSLD